MLQNNGLFIVVPLHQVILFWSQFDLQKEQEQMTKKTHAQPAALKFRFLQPIISFLSYLKLPSRCYYSYLLVPEAIPST